jgi:dephospho-CoA kinase
MPKVIGLTGGIGSGKTHVARLFAQKGVPIYISDIEAKNIMNSMPVVSEIKKMFGEDIYEAEELNRKKLAQIVFNDSQQLQKLNDLVHPLVKQHFLDWKSKQTTAYVLKESAILFESDSYKDCDIVITVEAPVEVRINRVIKRDKISQEEVESRMSKQWSESQRTSKSNYIIQNIDFDETPKIVDKIWQEINLK